MEIIGASLDNDMTAVADLETDALAGRKIAVVGKLEALNRRDLREFLRDRGAIPVEDLLEAELIVVGGESAVLEDLEAFVPPQVLERAGLGRVQMLTEPAFWQLAGLVEDPPQVRRLYTAAMLSDLLGVTTSTIRRWHRRGLIVPVQQVHRLAYYDFQEVATARRLAQLIQSGASPAAIEAKLSALTEWFPDIGRPLTQLSIIVEGRDVLLRRGEGLIEPNGQRRIDFAAIDAATESAAPSTPALRVVSGIDFSQPPQPVTAEDHLKLAAALEDEGQLGEAVQVYRGLLLGYGARADVCFALAELLYQMGELAAARERYFVAVELDPALVEARASLGCLLVEMHEIELAANVFAGALELYPDYADVHFHLGRCLDLLLRPDEALPHWRRFLQLSPESPWADEARQRLASGLAD